MAETRARKRIRKAVETRGYDVVSIEWEPWYDGGEMSGICGGWTVMTNAPLWPNTNYGDDAYGLNIEEVIASIDWGIRPPESCDCPEAQNPKPRSGSRYHGMPETPIHQPDCRWFIGYRLSWWDAEASP